MKISIVGSGVVGQATGKGFARLGHEVRFRDINEQVLANLSSDGYTVGPPGWGEQVCFVCVPEKQVDAEVADLLDDMNPYTLMVIRSTVPPGTTSRLANVYRRPFVHNPEFLREAVAELDFLNPPAIIIGANGGAGVQCLEELYRPFCRPIHVVPADTSELLKIVCNCYLATQISFWNQVKLVADSIHVSSHEIGMLLSTVDSRVSSYGARAHGKAYGGKCLPKDIAQLIDLCEGRGVQDQLLAAVRDINERIALYENTTYRGHRLHWHRAGGHAAGRRA